MALNPGYLKVTVEYGKDLKDTEWFGKQDPYAIVRCGHQSKRTKTAKDAGTNPVWNETFEFQIIDENAIELELRDHDTLTSDEILGVATVSLTKARMAGKDRLQAPVMSKKSGKQHGYVALQLAFQGQQAAPPSPAPEMPAQAFVMPVFQVAAPHAPMPQPPAPQPPPAVVQAPMAEPAPQPLPAVVPAPVAEPAAEPVAEPVAEQELEVELVPGVLRVTVEYARELKNCSWIGKQDPYAIVTCTGQPQKTKVASDSTHPVWHETVEFKLTDENKLQVDIMDKDIVSKDDVIGTADINLSKARSLLKQRLEVPLLSKENGQQRGILCLGLVFDPNGKLTEDAPAPVAAAPVESPRDLPVSPKPAAEQVVATAPVPAAEAAAPAPAPTPVPAPEAVPAAAVAAATVAAAAVVPAAAAVAVAASVPDSVAVPAPAPAASYEAPPPGYPVQGSAPQGYPPQGYAPQGYAPQGYAPQGYAPQGYAPQGYPQQSHPQAYVQPQVFAQHQQAMYAQQQIMYPQQPSVVYVNAAGQPIMGTRDMQPMQMVAAPMGPVAGSAPSASAPSSGFLEPGVLRVTIEYAKDLKDCDWIKKQDPYANVRCGTQAKRTQTMKGAGTCPVWHETLQFQVLNENQITIEVWDQDIMSPDDVIGTASVDLTTVRRTGKDHTQAPLFSKADNHNQGYVSVRLEFEGMPTRAAYN